MKQYFLLLTVFYAKAFDPALMDQLRALNLPNPSYPKSTKAITQSNLSNSATNMYQIRQSGRYYLESPLQAYPSGTNRNVIKIDNSNVTLDLNGMAITHLNSHIGINAIDITSGVSNIIIMNGFINKVTDIGINVGSNCHNIRILNVGISNCKGGGIQAASSNNIYLENVDISNCTGGGTNATGTGDAIGLYMTGCTGFTVKDSNFRYNQEDAGSKNGYGAQLVTCADGLVENCNFSSNSGQIGGGLSAKTNCTAIEFKKCKFNNNNGAGGIASGVEINTCQDLNFTECEASSNTAASGNAVQGFFDSAGTGNRFSQCKARYNNSTAAVSCGFKFDSSTSESIIDRCMILNNKSTTSGNVYGIHLANNVISSQVTKNFLINNTCLGTGNNYGYYDATAADPGTSTLLLGNIAYGQGACSPDDDENLDNSTSGNYYFQLAGTVGKYDGSPKGMILEQNIGLIGFFQDSGDPERLTDTTANSYDNISIYRKT